MSLAGVVRVVCAGLCVAYAGCGGDGPTEPAGPSGSLSFAFSGAESGSFSVDGRIGPATSNHGATAVKYDEFFPFMAIVGLRMRSATRGDFFDIELPVVTAPGVFFLDESGCTSSMTTCPVATFAVNLPVQSPLLAMWDAENQYEFTSGTVTVTSISSTRMTGTFDGSASNLLSGSAEKVITVTNGKFDVPILSPWLMY